VNAHGKSHTYSHHEETHHHDDHSHSHSHDGDVECSHSHSVNAHGKSHTYSHHEETHHHDDHSHSHGHGGDVECSHSHSHSHSHAHSHDNQNMRGIFLHVLADALGSVGVIISSGLVRRFGWTVADPVCSILISAMILWTVRPLLQETTSLLLQRVPSELEGQLISLRRALENADGVISGSVQICVWELSAGSLVCTCRIGVREGILEQRVLGVCHGIISASLGPDTDLCVEIFK
jgi:solute carrier family 30 (zinc transporter), member 5/7